MKRYFASLLLLLLLSPSLFAVGPVDRMESLGLIRLKDNPPLVDFELDDLSGQTVKLSSFTGKVVFLNFWATWCPPCRAEMPSMQKLHEALGSEGLEIIAVDLQEDQRSVQRFVDEYGLTFTVLLDKTGKAGFEYGAQSIPTSYIISRDGHVLGGAVGSRDWATTEYLDFFRDLLASD